VRLPTPQPLGIGIAWKIKIEFPRHDSGHSFDAEAEA
jgi:hypothetical protein